MPTAQSRVRVEKNHTGVIRYFSLAVALYASLLDLVKLPDYGSFRPLAPLDAALSHVDGLPKPSFWEAWVKYRWETIGKTSQSRLIFKSALL
jgi:hypothetical protein